MYYYFSLKQGSTMNIQLHNELEYSKRMRNNIILTDVLDDIPTKITQALTLSIDNYRKGEIVSIAILKKDMTDNEPIGSTITRVKITPNIIDNSTSKVITL